MSEEHIISGIVEVRQSEVALLLESGHLLMEMKKFKEAEEVFLGVAALIPHSEVPLICMGNLAFSQDQKDRALRFHNDALSRVPDSALALAHKGEVLLFMKKHTEAKDALQKAIAIESEGPAAIFANSLLDVLAAEVL
jgi:tetratricopeptide (TPR) repeat protein